MIEDVPSRPEPGTGLTEDADRRAWHIRYHCTLLAISLAVVVLSFTLRVRPDQLVEFRWLPRYPLPETCISRTVLNVECPGCGLTRSFIALARGDWSLAWQFHRTGWLLAAAVLIQFPYRLSRIGHLKRSGLPESESHTLNSLFSWTLIVALVGNWLLRLLGF
jgi:hypothetical protein